jgi:hypothetical protein
MLERSAAECPQCVLQPFGECHVALATQDDMNVLKARARQPEVIQPVLELHAGDTHGEVSHLGKIR